MRIDEYNKETKDQLQTRTQNASELMKDTRKKKPKHVAKKPNSKQVNKAKLKNKYASSGKKMHKVKSGKKGKDVEVDENSRSAAFKRRQKHKKNRKYSHHVDGSGEDFKTHQTSSGKKMHSQDAYSRKKLKPVRAEEVEEESKKPQKQKKRNPVHKNMYKTGKPGVHDKSKKGYKRSEEKKNNPDLGKLRDQVRTASIYD